GFRGKIMVHIHLSHGFSEGGTGEVDTALPAWTEFRNSIERFSDKSEVFVDERLRKKIAAVGYSKEGNPALQCVKRFAGNRGRQCGSRFRMPDDKGCRVLQFSGIQ